jgi:Na+/H+ antiporter NhaC
MKQIMVFVLMTFLKYSLNAQQNTTKTAGQLNNNNSQVSISDLPWMWMSFSAIAILALIIIGRLYNHKEN